MPPSKRSTPSTDTAPESQPSARPRRDIRKPKRYRSPSPSLTPPPNTDVEVDVDVVANDFEPEPEATLPPPPSSSKRPRKVSRRAAVVSSDPEDVPALPPPPKRRPGRPRKVRPKSESGESDRNDDDDGARYNKVEDKDEDESIDSPPLPQTKRRRGPPIRKSAGGDSQPLSLVFRDERARSDGTPMDLESPATASPAPAVASAQKAVPPTASTSTMAAGSSTSTAPAKPKLPKIRKIAGGASQASASASASTSTPQRPPLVRAKATTTDRDKNNVGGGDEDSERLAALIIKKQPKRDGAPTKTEVDLTDRNTYASLFRSAPGSTMRSESQEERRRTIERMRDEDCARRAAALGGAHAFDLRAQHDRIAAYAERTLHPHRSPALYPNILAASLRYQAERRRRRDGHAQAHAHVGRP